MQNFVGSRALRHAPADRMRDLLTVALAVFAAVILFLGSALPAWAADNMTLTFVRHGQSVANADGVTDTSVPGPYLTQLGHQQAVDVAGQIQGNNYDAIYASNMIRTQLTAQPLADLVGMSNDIVVLPGLREIEAGIFEGTPEIFGGLASTLFAVEWILGNRLAWIPGAINGYDLESRFNAAVQYIYDKRDVNNPNSVAFAHLGSIMAWTAMNVKNPDLLVMITHPLPNTGVVVINGNPEDGWTLVSWDGVAVAANPNLFTKLFIDTRNLVLTSSDAVNNITFTLSTSDPSKIATTIFSSTLSVAASPFVFVGSVIGDVISSIGDLIPLTASALPASLAAAADTVPAAAATSPGAAVRAESDNPAAPVVDSSAEKAGSVAFDEVSETAADEAPVQPSVVEPREDATEAATTAASHDAAKPSDTIDLSDETSAPADSGGTGLVGQGGTAASAPEGTKDRQTGTTGTTDGAAATPDDTVGTATTAPSAAGGDEGTTALSGGAHQDAA